jgi:hypothetical protein
MFATSGIDTKSDYMFACVCSFFNSKNVLIRRGEREKDFIYVVWSGQHMAYPTLKE